MPLPISQWFLTFPKCDAAKEDLLKHLLTIDTVIHYVVASEKHKDDTDHLHCYVKFQTGILKTNFLAFNFDVHHGNYQPVRSPKNVIKYCTKEDKYIANFDINHYLAKKGKLPIDVLKKKPVKAALEDGDIHFSQARNFIFAQSLLNTAVTRKDVCGIWLHGEPGTGKSHYARHLFPNAFIKQQNKWFDGYAGEGVILLEDFDSHQLLRHLKIWTDKWSASGEVKGASVPLQHKWFVITSNYTPEIIARKALKKDDEYDELLIKAVDRRFHFHEFKTDSTFVPPDGPIGPGTITYYTVITPPIPDGKYSPVKLSSIPTTRKNVI